MTKRAAVKSSDKPDLLTCLTSCASLLSSAILPKGLKQGLTLRFLRVCAVDGGLFKGTEDTEGLLVSALSELSEQVSVLEGYAEKGVIHGG
jgi:hypothetical protein